MTNLKDKNTIDPKDVDESINEAEAAEVSDEANEVEDELATLPSSEISTLYGGDMANAGTESVSQDDLNTPSLKCIQEGTKNIDNKKVGWFFRSDTQEQLETVDVNFICFETQEQLDYNKKYMETVKVYLGFYADTREPFKLFLRSTNLASHRQLQSEVQMYKNRLRVPMFALTVRLSSKEKNGVIKDSGKPYTTQQIMFEVLKVANDQSKPLIETDPNRIAFLYEAVDRFKSVAKTATEDENEHGDRPY